MNCATKGHIAIYHTWPQIKNAEYEVILRLIIAARNIGLDVTIIDNDGYSIWSSRLDPDDQRIEYGSCDFAISLHFESPKVIDVYTYVALWDRLEIYFMFGYEKSIMKLISHDDVLSCDSDLADAHALNLFGAINHPVQQPLPKLFHSLSRDVIEPHITSEARLFYIGINWERINNTRGRHHDLLVELDKTDMLDLYGPELFEGVRPWEGFDCYRGSIPFDGKSTVDRISEAGICLAFSSAAHQSTGIMSNRLFEGLAAGAFIIANKHPFLDKHFGDIITTVDDLQPSEKVLSDIKAIIAWVRKYPEKATEKARAAQNIFLERFSLESSLSSLVEGHNARASHIEALPDGLPTIDVILAFSRQSLNRLKEQFEGLKRQLLQPSTVFLILDETWFSLNSKQLMEMVNEVPFPVKILTTEIFEYSGTVMDVVGRKRIIGPAIWNAISMVTADSFIIIRPEEDFFHDHFSRLAAVLAGKECVLSAASGIVHEEQRNTEFGSRYSRRVGFLSPPDVQPYIYCNQSRYSGSHLYRSDIIKKISGTVFSLCDGEEHNYLCGVAFLATGISWTHAATLLYRDYDAAKSLPPIIAIEQQHQFIRDSLRSAPVRLEFLRQPKLPDVIFSTPLGIPLQWNQIRKKNEIGALMEPEVTYLFTQGGLGNKYLAWGFSQAESPGTWINGRVGIIDFSLGIPESCLLVSTKLTLVLEIASLADKNLSNQHVTVIVNGHLIDYQAVDTNNKSYEFSFDSKILENERYVRLKLICDHAEQIRNDVGVVTDARYLGVMVRSMRLNVKYQNVKNQNAMVLTQKLLNVAGHLSDLARRRHDH